MINKLYAVKDELANVFSVPFACENDAVAVRRFRASVLSETPNICNTNPEDKALYRLADYDVCNGTVTPGFEKLCNANSFLHERYKVEQPQVQKVEEVTKNENEEKESD